jgi:site-specific DNA recombinase
MSEILKAVIYTRVSTDEQAENGTSLADQQEQCLHHSERLRAVVIAVHEDAGVSGAKYETRPELQKALSAIERGAASLLIVTKIDRLSRSTRDVLDIAERVERAGGQILTCDGAELGKTPAGKLMLTQFAAFAEFERNTLRERTMRGRKNRARQGIQPNSSTPAYGYRVVRKQDIAEGRDAPEEFGKYIVIEEQARVVRRIFALYDSGKSLRSIAATLEADGIPTAKGAKHWQACTVRIILNNPVYKGQAVYNKEEAIRGRGMKWKRDETKILKCEVRYRTRPEDQWVTIPAPALVDADLWERCQARISQNADEKKAQLGGNPDRKFMLSGLIFCDKCGWRMNGMGKKSRKGERVAYYVCFKNPDCSCRQRSRVAHQVHDAIFQQLAFLYEQPEQVADTIRAYEDFCSGEGQNEAEREQVQSDLAAVERELENVKRAMFAAIRAGLREDDFAAELEAIARRRAALEDRLRKLSTPPTVSKKEPMDVAEKLSLVARAMAGVFAAAPEDFSEAEKQALLSQIVEKVIFHENGVSVCWKTENVYFINSHYWMRRAARHELFRTHPELDPDGLIDLVAQSRGQNPPDLVARQRAEWQTLFEWCASQP